MNRVNPSDNQTPANSRDCQTHPACNLTLDKRALQNGASAFDREDGVYKKSGMHVCSSH